MLLKYSFLTISFFLFTILNCSSSEGYDRGRITNEPNAYQYDDKEIQTNFNKKPQIRFPFKIAVFEDFDREVELSTADKENFIQLEESLQDKKIVSKLFFINTQILPESEKIINNPNYNSVKKARLLASRYESDTVLILRKKLIIESNHNLLSVLYLTIIGAWIFPGTEREYKLKISTALWDSRNEYLYATADSETVLKKTRPVGWFDNSEIIEKLKKESIHKLKEELQKRITNLKQ
jgi:rhombotail lipoprotein